MCIGNDKLFLIQGDSLQTLKWEKYGLRIIVPQGTLSPTDTCEVSVAALVGGQFQLPEESELISAVYNISVSKPLLKPVTLEIQHCADIVTQDHTSYLCFATASVNTELPYQFQLKDGGHFHPGDQYGSISLSQFSLWCVVKNYIKRLLRYPIRNESSSDDEFFDALEPSIQECGNEDDPSKGILNTK